MPNTTPDVPPPAAPHAPDLPELAFARAAPFRSGRPERDGPLWDEWVLTNGLGGFAMGTALSVPTRRYHGLLVAATTPPVGRVLALAQIADSLTLDPGGPNEHAARLSLFHFESSDDRPEAHDTLARFVKDESVRWTYDLPGGASVRKTVHLFRRRNAVAVRYEIDAKGPWRLELRPLLALRDMHDLPGETDEAQQEDIRTRALPDEDGRAGVLTVRGPMGVHVTCDPATYREDPTPWHDVRYEWEALRGQDEHTDAYHAPGVFVREGSGPGVVTLTASTDTEPLPTIDDDRADRLREGHRLEASVFAGCTEAMSDRDSGTLRTLARLSDDFVVERVGEADFRGASVIAGYPWFTDWGRDTMICLPGLMLATGRTDEAFRTLETFGAHRLRGLIPNRFTDDGPAEYNTVDAPLWYIHACCRYLAATGDRAGFERELLPACDEIVHAYKGGTDFGIGADEDGLITAGDEHTQLTWMDAKRDGVTFTPRHGKAVEINALWHNALASLEEAVRPDHQAMAAELHTMALRVASSFRAAFLGGPGGGLIDCLTPTQNGDGWITSTELRPNQVFAVSLPHSPLEPDERRRVVEVVAEHLLTPVGLRTLAPGDPAYKPRFEGAMMDRDGAYHNGTVWPWLLGPFAEAVMRADGFSDASRAEARRLLAGLADRARVDVVGQLCEVYDADEPRRPDGCMAQAWSVAEPLRVYRLSLRAQQA